MFEDVSPFKAAKEEAFVVSVADDSRAGDALRAIGWSELAARINAARDLREVLRRDAIHGSVSEASFSDGAANYFAALGTEERDVNPVVLEGRKASPAIVSGQQQEAARGDAREIND
ncbi:MAG: hypothetical protein AAGK02_15740 [Pseudomonadota bacterium]